MQNVAINTEPAMAHPFTEGGIDTNEPLPLAKQVLNDTPIYVEHIRALMGNCVAQLRAGNDRMAMRNFARGTADLSQFVQLVDQLAVIARPKAAEHIKAFKSEMDSSVRQMESALTMQDFVALSDRIEDSLLNLLSKWPAVASELSTGIESQLS